MSKSKKKDIGKGIRALLTNIEEEQKSRSPQSKPDPVQSTDEVPVSQVVPNPFQPRSEFAEDLLEELAESIRTFGVIQPITVRRLSARKYQIISGERRWRAAEIAGLETMPAYVREADDQGMLEMALLENIQRTDLNPIEIGLSYKRLMDECKLTHEELSSRLGKKRSSITNYVRILKLPPSVQKAIQSQLISMGHAKILAGVSRVEDQVYLLDQVLRRGLSVRATESLKDQLDITKKPLTSPGAKHPEVQKMEDKLSDLVGRPVKISRSSKGNGSIKISFSSDRELNNIIESLLG